MKAKLDKLMVDLGSSSAEIETCYTNGVVDGFSKEPDPQLRTL